MAWLLSLWLYRAKTVALMALLGWLIGEPLARWMQFDTIASQLRDGVQWLNTKLNRAHRSVATRVYRGILLWALLAALAWAASAVLQQPNLVMGIMGSLVLIALFGRGFSSYSLVRVWRESRAGTLKLEQHDTLFSDTHGVLRYCVATSAERLCTFAIGGGFWFILGGFHAMLTYLAFALAARQLPPSHESTRAFGWAIVATFGMMHYVPALLCGFMVWGAGFFTPFAQPRAGLHGIRHAPRSLQKLVADMLDIALGGTQMTPAGEIAIPWVGQGTAQLTHKHLTGWCWLWGTASLVWVLVLLMLANL